MSDVALFWGWLLLISLICHAFSGILARNLALVDPLAPPPPTRYWLIIGGAGLVYGWLFFFYRVVSLFAWEHFGAALFYFIYEPFGILLPLVTLVLAVAHLLGRVTVKRGTWELLFQAHFILWVAAVVSILGLVAQALLRHG